MNIKVEKEKAKYLQVKLPQEEVRIIKLNFQLNANRRAYRIKYAIR
jgi:hypothetical protein